MWPPGVGPEPINGLVPADAEEPSSERTRRGIELACAPPEREKALLDDLGRGLTIAQEPERSPKQRASISIVDRHECRLIAPCYQLNEAPLRLASLITRRRSRLRFVHRWMVDSSGVLVDRDQGVTVIVPFIEVWIEQRYANVAAVLKVCAYVPPLESVPLLVKPPSMLVTVCRR